MEIIFWSIAVITQHTAAATEQVICPMKTEVIVIIHSPIYSIYIIYVKPKKKKVLHF